MRWLSAGLVSTSMLLLAACDGQEAPRARTSTADDDLSDASSSAIRASANAAQSRSLAAVVKPYTVVRADWTMGKDLSAILASQRTKAAAKHQQLYLELSASWCTSCEALHAAMGDPEMAKAFTGAYVVRIDVDELGQQAVELGFNSKDIPAFYEVGPDGRATGRWIDGNAWSGGTPEQMAPALREFFSAGAS